MMFLYFLSVVCNVFNSCRSISLRYLSPAQPFRNSSLKLPIKAAGNKITIFILLINSSTIEITVHVLPAPI